MLKNVTLVREGAFVRTAVIILGHGSRNTGADEAIRKVVDGVKVVEGLAGKRIADCGLRNKTMGKLLFNPCSSVSLRSAYFWPSVVK
jgi:hypothetical protein